MKRGGRDKLSPVARWLGFLHVNPTSAHDVRAPSPPPSVMAADDDPDRRGLLSPEDNTSHTRSATRFTYLPAVVLFLSELAELLLVAPRIRLLEASICRSYYNEHDPSSLNPDGSVDETLCKLKPVQTELAYIRGWQVFWEAIPVLALAIPWGALADRIGRKKVLAVNFAGCILHILWFLAVCECAQKS